MKSSFIFPYIKSILNSVLEVGESLVLCKNYPLRSQLTSRGRITLIFQLLLERIHFRTRAESEIRALICTVTDERLLLPILLRLLDEINTAGKRIKVSLVVIKPLNQSTKDELLQKGCQIETDLACILKPCIRPQGKLVLFCLDQRLFKAHARGVAAADTLKKFGVKTVSIQHGGTRKDAVEGLASSASNTILIWGQRVFRQLTRQYNVQPERLRIVGNHLHDRIKLLDKENIFRQISQVYPSFFSTIKNKKIVLLATCLHSEYADRNNEQALYKTYIQHLYQSLSFSEVCLVIKMHPGDQTAPNLYREFIPSNLPKDSILIVEPAQSSLDVYSLLHISDLLITRASTVAEEALMMQKKVVAFDLDQFGPSQAYQHLEEYETYKTVYLTPEFTLGKVVTQMLTESPAQRQQSSNIENELTYALDGKSMNRTINEILQLLYC